MIRIEPLGTGVILPAIVVGYDVTGLAEGTLEEIEGRPDWLLTLDQQAGGLAMSYPSVAGAVLRLEANRGRGLHGLDDLIRGLRLMAEDPDLVALGRDYPVLRRAVLTHGDPYDRQMLADLDNFLGRWLTLPPLEGGCEAHLRFAPCDPLGCFSGWKLLSCSAIGNPSDVPFFYDCANLDLLTRQDVEGFDASHLDALRGFGRSIGRAESPRVFLLWENSD